MGSLKISNKRPGLVDSPHIKAEFVKSLLQWHHSQNNRVMPWKGEKDPYKIWLSEIILQQTRVEQGLKYYQNFILAFPDVHALAKAPEEKVFKAWEGLGYYSRCRNLIMTARVISHELHGRFPDTYQNILELKGIGPYTAAAIGSFAFNLPFAVVDGNVFRVLSRIFDNDTPIDSSAGKKLFSSLAQEILPVTQAAEYNQAIMDFGATVCKPVPDCGSCFFNARCSAFLNGRQLDLPVKEKKIKTRDRWLNYFILDFHDEILIRQRQSDIWQRLYEFVLIETEKPSTPKQTFLLLSQKFDLKGTRQISESRATQKLTHQQIHFSFAHLSLGERVEIPGFMWVAKRNLENYAFPRTLQNYIVSQLG